MNCPKCDAPDFYLGITSQACSSDSCELYVKPQESCPELLYVEGAGSTGFDASQWRAQPYPNVTKDEHPSESPDDVGIGSAPVDALNSTQWEIPKSYLGPLPKIVRGSFLAGVSAKPVTGSTPLTEVHDNLSEEELSRFQQLESSLRSIDGDLVNLMGSAAQASGQSTPPYPSCVVGMRYDLSVLRAKLRRLEGYLEQCDQSLHRLQSEDQHPLSSHKSEDTCQKDTAPYREVPPNPTTGIQGSHADLIVVDDLCSLRHSSNVSSSRSPSYGTQSPAPQTGHVSNTSRACSPGFQKVLSDEAGQVVTVVPARFGKVELRAALSSGKFAAVHVEVEDLHWAPVKHEMLTWARWISGTYT